LGPGDLQLLNGGGREEEKILLFLKKKKQKDFYLCRRGDGGGRAQIMKSFWFYFAKTNIFLLLTGSATIGRGTR
jgi:hypothetical protein